MSEETKENLETKEKKENQAQSTLNKYKGALSDLEATTSAIMAATEHRDIHSQLEEIKAEFDDKKAGLRGTEYEETVESDVVETQDTKPDLANETQTRTTSKFGEKSIEFGVNVAQPVGDENSTTKDTIIQRYKEAKITGIVQHVRNTAEATMNNVGSLLGVSPLIETESITPEKKGKTKESEPEIL